MSLDITNAFNSIPWPSIAKALERTDIPEYLRRMIDSYLFERSIEYVNAYADTVERLVTVGIPQGSVMSPIL